MNVQLLVNGREVPAILIPAFILVLCSLTWYHGRYESWIRKSIERDRELRKKLLDSFKGLGCLATLAFA